MPNALTSFNTYVSTCNNMKKGTTVAANSRNSYWAAGRMTEGPVTSTLLTPNSKNGECPISPARARCTPCVAATPEA